jgi:anaerobic selenocysteine-containing dehydrogenase
LLRGVAVDGHYDLACAGRGWLEDVVDGAISAVRRDHCAVDAGSDLCEWKVCGVTRKRSHPRPKNATILLRSASGTMPILRKARLTQPLVRENDSHRPATWDEAMDCVVGAFRKSIEKNDPRDFGMFSCSKTTNELNYAAQKFVRSVMGSNNIDSCNRT